MRSEPARKHPMAPGQRVLAAGWQAGVRCKHAVQERVAVGGGEWGGAALQRAAVPQAWPGAAVAQRRVPAGLAGRPSGPDPGPAKIGRIRPPGDPRPPGQRRDPRGRIACADR